MTSATLTPSSPECTATTGLTQIRNVHLHGVGLDLSHPVSSGVYPGVPYDQTLATIAVPPVCVPPNTVPLSWAGVNSGDYSDAVSIDQVIPDSPACTAPSDALIYSINPAPVGTGSGGGITVTLTALRGHARIGRSCGDGICTPTSLDEFQLDLADLTISGVTLRKLRVNSTMPAPITPVFEPDSGMVPGIAQGAFRLRAVGQGNTDAPNGSAVPVTIRVDANGAIATPGAAACTTQSGRERVLGFEDVDLWSSTQAQLSLVTAPVQQGCGALGQPNPYWIGALQAHLSCPSGGVNNQYIGQVELTGKPLNRYSTLRFPLSSAVRTSLARPLDDCSITFGLNVNQTGNTWILDALRFTP